MPDELSAQSAGVVLGGCRPRVSAQEEGHGLLKQRRGAEPAQQGRQQGGGGQDTLLRPKWTEQ